MDENIPTYAGFWRRFAAYMLDAAVISWAMSEFWINAFNHARAQFAILKTTNESVVNRYDTAELYAAVFMLIVIVPFVWGYFSGMESSPLRATLGKLAVGIYVTDLNGQRISFSRATGRYFGKFISGMLFGIGDLIAGTSEKKQALRDSMAGCLVLSK